MTSPTLSRPAVPEPPLPRRELEALREIARTRVSRAGGWALAIVFLATAFAVPTTQAVWELAGRPDVGVPTAGGGGGIARATEASDPASGPPAGWHPTARSEADDGTEAPFPHFIDFFAAFPRAWAAAREAGFFAGNREVLAAMTGFEDDLEEGSVLRRLLVPPVQNLVTAALGLGNEEAYPGRDGWLFYRPDIDYVTGPGFGRERVLARRSRGGQAWEAPPQPDPLPAILDLHRELAERGIRLVVFPTPVKPMVHPEAFSTRFESSPPDPLQNPSFGRFRRALEAAGVPVFTAEEAMAAGGIGPRYLRSDTHWRPEAMEAAARDLAALVEAAGELPPALPAPHRRVAREVENLGDVAAMLSLPAGQELYPEERVTIRRVFEADGSPWRPRDDAPVLLLGDSFTNVYSQAGLGWGEGAGLAEQLSFHLRRPVDRIALNAGGSHATRAALAAALARGDDRLAGKRVVVYQFADRELAAGDWRLFDLARPAVAAAPPEEPAGEPAAAPAPATVVVGGVVREIAAVPDPETTPYREAIVALHLGDLQIVRGAPTIGLEAAEIVVYAWGMRDRRLTPAARLRPGQSLEMTLVPWQEVAADLEGYQRLELGDPQLLALPAFWAEAWERR